MTAVAWTAIGRLAAALFGNLYYLGGRIDALSARIDALRVRLDARIDTLGARLHTLTARFGDHIDATLAELPRRSPTRSFDQLLESAARLDGSRHRHPDP